MSFLYSTKTEYTNVKSSKKWNLC